VLHQLLEALRDNDNSHNAFDDAHWIAGLVDALGACRPSNTTQLALVLAAIDRALAHEAVVGTHCSVVGAACLRAVAALACRVQPPVAIDAAAVAVAGVDPGVLALEAATRAARELLGDAKRLLMRYAGPNVSHHLRVAAQECLMQVGAPFVEGLAVCCS